MERERGPPVTKSKQDEQGINFWTILGGIRRRKGSAGANRAGLKNTSLPPKFPPLEKSIKRC